MISVFSQWSPCGRKFYPPCGRPTAGPGRPPPPACVFSAPGHSCSGALRPRPACSPLRGTRARGRSAPGRTSRPQATPPPARESPSAPPPPAAGYAAPCAREPLRSAPSGRRLRTARSGFRPPAGQPPLRRFINVNPQIYKCKFTDIN